MSDRNIDNAYKKAFPKQEYNYKPEYWDQMESMMGPASPRIPSVWWKAASGVLAVATAASVWFWNTAPTDALASGPQNPKAEVVVSQPATQLAESPSTEEVKNSVSAVETPAANTEQKTSLKVVKSPESTPKKQTARVNVKTASQASFVPTRTQSSSTITKKTTPAKLTLASNSSGVKTFDPSIGSGSSVQQTAASVIHEPIAESISSEQSNSVVEFEENNTPSLMKSKALLVYQPDLSPSAELNTSSSESSSGISRNPLKMPQMHFYFGASAGYMALQNNESLIIQPGNSYRDLAIQVYENKSVEAGIDMGVKYRNFILQSGVKYSNLSQAYEMSYLALSQKEEMKISHREVIESVTISRASTNEVEEREPDQENPNPHLGSNIEILFDTTWGVQADTSFVQFEEAKNQLFHSSYSINYAQIPMYVGYELPLKKFYLHVSTGMDMAVLTSASGTVYDPETQSIVAQLDKSELNPVLWKYRLNLGVGYRVSQNFSLYVNPSYIRSLNTAYKEGHTYAGKFSGYGLNAGLRYEF